MRFVGSKLNRLGANYFKGAEGALGLGLWIDCFEANQRRGAPLDLLGLFRKRHDF